MKKALSILLLLLGLNLHAQVQGQGSWIVGSLVNIFGTTNIPQKYVRFIPPPGQMLALGTNTVVPVTGMANITNGNFIVWLVGPFVYTADFGPIPGQGQATVPILVPNSSNTLSFNVAAQLAVNSKMFPGTNIVININTNINSGTNYSIFTVTNGLNFYAGNAGILVQTNFNTNIAVSTTFLMSDVTNAVFPLSRIANSTNVFMTNGSLAGTWSVSSLSVASGTGAFSGTFNGQHQGDVSLTTGSPFATNAMWATNLAGIAPSASNVLNVVGWTNLPSNVLSNQQAGVTLATTPSAQLTLTNSGTSRAAQLVATNVGAATQGVYVSSGSGGPAAVAASEFVGPLTGVATQATHATNADLASLAVAVPWTGITGTPNLATNTYVGISNALGFPPATNGSGFGTVTWTSITGVPNLATNTYVGISNALNFQAATNGGAISMSQVTNSSWATNTYIGITNALGYPPVTNNFAGVTNALGYKPMTNGANQDFQNTFNLANVNLMNANQVTANAFVGNLSGDATTADRLTTSANISLLSPGILGPMATSNGNLLVFSYNGNALTNLNGGAIVPGTVGQAALTWVSATNSNAGMTNALGYIPMTNTYAQVTNTLGYIPAGSNYLSISNALGFQIATNGFVVATNAIGITSGSTGTNPVLFANPSGVNMTWTNPAVPLGIEPRVVGANGLNIRSSGNVDNVTVQASKFSATGVPGVSGDGSGLNNVAASSLASGAIVNNPIVTGGTFSGITIASGNGVGLTNVPAVSMTGTITNPVNAAGDVRASGVLAGSLNYTNLDAFSSNIVLNTPTRPLAFSPVDLCDAKGHMTFLDFGDSTAQFPESPVQVVATKMLQRYGFGGFVAYPSTPSSMITALNDPFALVWTATSGNVSVINGQDNPSVFWGPVQASIGVGGTLMWTNRSYLPPGATQAVLNPGGQWFGATKGAVWYACSPTNSLGQFQVLTSTNGGPFGVAATVNCATGSSSLTTTNVVIQFSTIPTTNYYQLMVTGIVGTVNIPQGGLWNEYAGFTHYDMSLGGWNPDKFWRPDVERNASLTWAQPSVPSWMTNAHDNLFKDLPVDLAMICNAHMTVDNTVNAELTPQTDTYTNEAFHIGDLSQTLLRWNPNVANIWVTQYPCPTNQAGGWPYQPYAVNYVIKTNNTGHDYCYFSGKSISGEKWTNQFGTAFFLFPHWSPDGGLYVGTEVLKEMNSWSSAQKTYTGTFNGQKASAAGFDAANGTSPLDAAHNYGYAFSFGADIGANTRTAGIQKYGAIGYLTPDSTIPDAALLTYSSFGSGTTFVFGDQGPNGQAFNHTNFWVFRSAGSNLWNVGSVIIDPDGTFDYGAMYNTPQSIFMNQAGTLGAATITSTGARSAVTINTNTIIGGGLTVNGNITENSSGGWVYTNLPNGVILKTNVITGAWETLGTTGNFTNSGSFFAANISSNIITPEMFGAKGDLSVDDTTPVLSCELTANMLIAKGIAAQSYYANHYLIHAPLAPTNRFNIKGISRPGGVFIQTPAWAPTFVFTGNSAIDCRITNTCFSGSVIDGITCYSSNQWFHSNASGPGSAGIILSATTNGLGSPSATANFLDIQVNNCQYVGSDWGLLATNVDDLVVYNMWGQTTNGLACVSSNGFSSNPQGCHFERIQGAYSGIGIFCDNTYASLVSCDVSMTAVGSISAVWAQNSSRLSIINPNFEMNSTLTSDTNHYMLHVDNSLVNIFGGSMNLANGRPFGYQTNQGIIHLWGQPNLPSVGDRILIVSDNTTEGQSTIDQPILNDTYLYYLTNRVLAAKTNKLTLNSFNHGEFDALKVTGAGAASVAQIQNGNLNQGLNLGADSSASTLTSGTTKIFSTRWAAKNSTTFDNNFIYLNDNGTPVINFGGNDSDASAGNAPSVYYFHAVNGGGGAGGRVFEISQYGFASYGTNHVTYTNVAGWTNAFGLITPWEINVTAYVSGTSGLSVFSDPTTGSGAGTLVFGITGTYTNVPVTMHPNWAIRGTGITGVSVAQ